MRRQNLVTLSCSYAMPFELVTEIVFHYCTTPPYHKIDPFKRPFRGSRFERLDDAFVLLISLSFLYQKKILISVRFTFKLFDVQFPMILVNYSAIWPKTIFMKRCGVEIMSFFFVFFHRDVFFDFCSLFH